MITLTALVAPVLKGFAGVAGGSLLVGGTSYVVYKKSIKEFPLTEYLEKVTDKKFKRKHQVSRTIQADGVIKYMYKIPAGYSVKNMSDLREGIENKFDCEMNVWAEGKKFVIEVCSHPIPDELYFERTEVEKILKDYEFGMYLGESRKGHVVLDFTNNATPHLLFGGPTGGGKSNMLNQGICGIVSRYTPEEAQLVLIDMKDGVELGPYKDMKHVRKFCETFSEVEAELSLILLELKRRNALFKKAGVKKLSQYNQLGDPLPRVLIIADEFAQFNNIGDKELKKSIMNKWEEILQKGRSTGIHVCIGTQVADADVFPKQVKGNIDARFGFKFTDIQHSKMISGGSELTNLPNIIGRGLFKLGTVLVQTQVPYICEDDMESIIERNRREEEEYVPGVIEEAMGENPVEETEESSEADVLEIPDIESLFIQEEDLKRKPATGSQP